MRDFFHDEFLPQGNFLRFLSKYGCDQNFVEEEICALLIFTICGYDPEQFDYVSNDSRSETPIETCSVI